MGRTNPQLGSATGELNISLIGAYVYYTGSPVSSPTLTYIQQPLRYTSATNTISLDTPYDVATDFGTTGTAYLLTNGNFPNIVAGMQLTFCALHASTTSTPTLNVNGWGAWRIVGPTGGALAASGDITACGTTGSEATVKLGANKKWWLLNPQTSSGGGGGTTTNALTGAASGGAAPGTTFNGSIAQTFDYHTLGAQQALTLTTTGTSGPATLSAGALNIPQYSGGSSLPSGTTDQMLYYATSGTTVTPLDLGTNLSITGTTLNASGGAAVPAANTGRMMTSDTSGSSVPQTVIAEIGNSLVSNDTGFLPELCNEATTYGISAPPYCITAGNGSVDGSGNVTLNIANSNNAFKAGTYFTAYSAAFDGGCLFGTYIVTSATSTSIVFPTVPSGTTCSAISSTASNALISPDIVKFGIGGASLDAWYASSAQGGYGGYKTWIQSAIAAGQFPVTIMTDAGIMTNSTRTSAVSYSAFLSDLQGVIQGILATTATAPGSVSVTLADYPFYVTTGNPNSCWTTTTGSFTSPCSGGSNTGTGGVYVPPVGVSGAAQYVFPYGTAGSTYATPATITSGAISAGTQTVTINPCPPDLWGGPGDQLPTQTNFAGQLLRDGNLLQMVVDTSGSGVQELITLTGLTATGATGLNGFQTCNVTANFAFAHAANAQIYTTEFTADQEWTEWKQELAQDAARLFPGNVNLIDTLGPMGKTVFSYGTLMANELHPRAEGYSLMGKYILAAAAPYFIAPPKPQLEQNTYYQADAKLESLRTPSIDYAFNTNAAAAARFQNGGSFNSGVSYRDAAVDPVFFYPKLLCSGVYGYSSSYVNIYCPDIGTTQTVVGDAETGDYLWSQGGGSWQPTTLSAAITTAGVEKLTYTGTPPNNFSGVSAVMSPYFVDANQGANFLSHPLTYPLNGVYNVSVATGSTTNTLNVTINPTQNPFIIGGQVLQCAQLEMRSGDYVLFAGNAPNAAGGPGVSVLLGAGSWGPTSGTDGSKSCSWTDSSGTDYSAYIGRQANLIHTYRFPTLAFVNFIFQQEV